MLYKAENIHISENIFIEIHTTRWSSKLWKETSETGELRNSTLDNAQVVREQDSLLYCQQNLEQPSSGLYK